ncbi:MAG: hypothetical protein PHS49_08315 [Candidatus Gracilibacteria bacterium]|nr:hypothetical protein [Candidatus Gracilibacteria bacterium]
MENNEKLSIGKILLIVVLGLIILLGLFGAGCGGLFTISFLLGNGGGYDLYIISVPSLIAGVIFVYGGYKGIKKILKSRNLDNENNSKLYKSEIHSIILFGILLIAFIIYLTYTLTGLSIIPLLIIGILIIFGLFIGIHTFIKPKKINKNKSENTEKNINEEKENHIEL